MYNTILYILLLLFSLYISYFLYKKINKKTKKTINIYLIIIFFVIYYVLFFILEYLDIFAGLRIWSQKERTTNCYDWFEHFLKKNYGIVNGKPEYDYTENIYFDDYTISNEQSLNNKYNLIFKELNLSAGKKLLDCGSGICTWIDFCKNKGVEVIGLTLSEEQKEVCLKKKITSYVQDFRILDEKFIGKFLSPVKRKDVLLRINELKVVEYYSR
jgi:hypothetical protein